MEVDAALVITDNSTAATASQYLQEFVGRFGHTVHLSARAVTYDAASRCVCSHVTSCVLCSTDRTIMLRRFLNRCTVLFTLISMRHHFVFRSV